MTMPSRTFVLVGMAAALVWGTAARADAPKAAVAKSAAATGVEAKSTDVKAAGNRPVPGQLLPGKLFAGLRRPLLPGADNMSESRSSSVTADDNGITVTVTRNGISRTVNAKTPDELRLKDLGAYEVYRNFRDRLRDLLP